MTTDPSPATAFAVTWDYRCPFARNVHEHLVAGLRAGAAWDVRFVAFSLGQVHVVEGEPDIWERPQDDTGLLALQAGVVVRDTRPDRFLDAHEALFALRHDHGGHLRNEASVRDALLGVGVDADAVFAAIATGDPLLTVRQEHEASVKEHAAWGVPTFLLGDQAVFARIMDRPEGDGAHATRTIERVLDLMTWTDLNEFKHTSIPR
ncbi:MAG: hypothetical protein Q8K58_14130 [Acidimicrobiales bacterium]|nr:hypothetical protein [Acidimicrobiales bacterium]